MAVFSWKNLFFSTLLIGISSGALYAYNAYGNYFPYGTQFPDGHWIIAQIPGDAYSCFQLGSWLWVMQKNAIISVFWFTDNYGYNVVSLPYVEPVWVYGYPNDQGGVGCTVWPGQTLSFTSNASWVNDPGGGGSTLLSCYLHCP